MKRRVLITVSALLIILIAVSALVWHNRTQARPESQAKQPLPLKETTVGVNSLMSNVDQYRGRVLVEGVVSATVPDQHLIGVIDLEEYRQCQTVTCSQLTLPVRWQGQMPKQLDIIRIDGKLTETAGGLIFVASNLQRISAK